jgi:hypothetical protein
VNYIGMYIRSKKIIKMRMETLVGLYGKGMKSSLGTHFVWDHVLF